MNFKKGLRDGLPIGLGYFSVSIAFGVSAATGGLSCIEAMLISLLNLTSAGQKAGLDIIIAGGSLIEIALSQLLINARYALMGVSLAQKIDSKFTAPRRIILGFAITDEIFAVASGTKILTYTYMAGLAILPIIGWTSGTFCGALIGSIVPPIIQSALGVALYGMFIAVFVPAAKQEKYVLCVVGISVFASCLIYYLPIFSKISSGFSVIICTIIAATLGAVLFPVKEEERDAV